MNLAQSCLLILLVVLHFYFMVLEMFFWTRPLGLRVFAMTASKAKDSAALAANQGLYNGFLAVGLLWALIHPELHFAKQLAIFFCSCVVIAGAYGAFSVSKKILFVQALPGALALALLLVF